MFSQLKVLLNDEDLAAVYVRSGLKRLGQALLYALPAYIFAASFLPHRFSFAAGVFVLGLVARTHWVAAFLIAAAGAVSLVLPFVGR